MVPYQDVRPSKAKSIASSSYNKSRKSYFARRINSAQNFNERMMNTAGWRFFGRAGARCLPPCFDCARTLEARESPPLSKVEAGQLELSCLLVTVVGRVSANVGDGAYQPRTGCETGDFASATFDPRSVSSLRRPDIFLCPLFSFFVLFFLAAKGR